jgi:ligand-binding sensor domain-containing protein
MGFAPGWNRSRRLLVLLLLFLVPVPEAAALDPKRRMSEYIVDFWQEDSGLPQKYVYVIRQTRDGYLWVGTRSGLARFDGVRFTVFDDRQEQQLQESEVTSLDEAPDGSLWIGTNGGGVSHLRDGRFTTYGAEDGLPSAFITDVAHAPDGAVWIGTNGGVARLKDGHVTRYTKAEGMPDERVHCVYVDDAGVVWIGLESGLATLRDGRVEDQTASNPQLHTYVRHIVPDGAGGLWLASRAGLIRFKDGVGEIVTTPRGLILGLSVDPQGTVWFATQSKLFRYRDGVAEMFEQAEFMRVGADRTLKQSTLNNIQTLATDREGSVWIGTAQSGMARLRDAVFSTVTDESSEDDHVRVPAVFGDSQGAVWLALGGGEVGRYKDGVLERVRFSENGNVDTFCEDLEGAIWAADGKTIAKYRSGRFVNVPEAKAEGVVASLADRSGNIWFGGSKRGLFRYRDGQVTQYTKAEGLPGEAVRGLAEDKRGAIWIGTRDGGLARWSDGRFTTWGRKEGLPSASVSAVHVDPDDAVWVATRRGLVRIRDGRVSVFTARHGLPANFFYQIVGDDLGYLWLTYGRGILRLSRQELNDVADGKAAALTYRTFGMESGMKNTSMVIPNQPAATRARDGRLWFGTGDGAAVVDPRSLVQNQVVPPVWVEEIRVDDRRSPARADATFPPGEGDVELRYTGLSFVAPQSVRFRYKLEGFDADWIDAETRRVAYYTNLPPRSYVFHVKACNNDGVWNDTGHSVRFHLRPHWYQTGWFRVGALLTLGMGLLGVHRLRLREHKRRAAELQKRVDEAVGQIKMLNGMLPICASCKKIRDDSGYWNQMESYIAAHSQADFSHGICPDCLVTLYPEYAATREEPKGS